MSALTSILIEEGATVTTPSTLTSGMERRDAIGAAGLAAASATLILHAADSNAVHKANSRFRGLFGDKAKVTVTDENDPSGDDR